MTVDTSKAPSRTAKPGGCGCGKPTGGSPCACNCTCACGCHGALAECPESGILRPNFFAGQLLTEDDLQQITLYQMAKRRLTNRYVFGTGVVCGYNVVADPQKTGGVIVEPGYALDCCGNDLVLPCPCPLDINAMVRAEGLDCGEPCAGDADHRGKPHRYLLYVKYAERLSEPVSPYSPDGTTSCVNTRVQELVRFELRCPPKKANPCENLVTRLRDALEKGAAEGGYSVDLERWDDLCKNADKLMAEQPPVSPGTLEELKAAPGQIKAVTDTFPTRAAPHPWTEEKLKNAVDGLLVPARTIARLVFVGPLAREAMQNALPGATPAAPTPAPAPTAGPAPTPAAATTGPATPTIEDQLNEVISKLADAGRSLGRLIAPSFSAATRTRALLLVQEIARWTDSNSAHIGALRTRHDVRLFVLDAKHPLEPYSFDRYHDVMSALSRQYFWAKPPSGDDFTADMLRQVCDQGSQARDAMNLDLRSTLCDLINPPCTCCDDLGVLLACIDVHHCKVVGTCNLVRTIIVSPAALGYWLPLHEVLELLCCGDRRRRDQRDLLQQFMQPYQDAARAFVPRESDARESPQPAGVQS
jgi:hypothetical protein